MEGAQLQCSHLAPIDLFSNPMYPPRALSLLPLSQSYGPHKKRSPFTPPYIPNKFSPTPPTPHASVCISPPTNPCAPRVHRHPPTPPRVPMGISPPPPPHVPPSRHSPLHPYLPPTLPSGHSYVPPPSPPPHTPPGAPCTPAVVQHHGQLPARCHVRGRRPAIARSRGGVGVGGGGGCRRPYIARSGRAARAAGAAGGAAAAVSIPPTSHPAPLLGRGPESPWGMWGSGSRWGWGAEGGEGRPMTGVP